MTPEEKYEIESRLSRANQIESQIEEIKTAVENIDGAKDSGQTVVRYLHEAEAFLALHGVELIKE